MTTPTVQPVYQASAVTTVTITLASLATSSSLTAGREATAPTANSTSLFDDVIVTGKITVGTTPTANTSINVYVFAALDYTPTWPDVMTGSDAAATITSAGVGQGYLRLGIALNCDSTTSNRAYPFSFALAPLFGGNVPRNWSIFVVHNTGVNLNSTGGNHVVQFYGVNYAIPSI